MYPQLGYGHLFIEIEIHVLIRLGEVLLEVGELNKENKNLILL